MEFVQDAVRDGLSLTIVNSIRFICDQLEQEKIEKNALPPLLEIKLGLLANDVMPIAEEAPPAPASSSAAGASASSSAPEEKGVRTGKRDVWQMVSDWVDGFFDIGKVMTRLDGSHYVGDLKKNEAIMRFINNLKKLLDANQKENDTWRAAEYLRYDALWKNDRQTEFQKFLQGALSERKAAQDAAQAEKDKRKAEAKAGLMTGRTPRKEGKEGEAGGAAAGGDAEAKDDNALINEIMPLDKFEEKIVYYLDLQREIASKPRIWEIGWLRIDAALIKTQLAALTSKWVSTYTSFLYNDVTRKLYKLESLQKEVNAGLLEEVTQGDSATLKKVLGYIHKVRSVEESTRQMFGPMKVSQVACFMPLLSTHIALCRVSLSSRTACLC